MSDEARVAAAIEERAGELVELASELIAFDTTTRGEPDEPARAEAALQERLAALLRDAGAEVELFEPEPGALDRWTRQVPEGLGFAGRPQLVARFGGAGEAGAACCSTATSTSSPPSRASAGRATRSRPRSATGGSMAAAPAT